MKPIEWSWDEEAFHPGEQAAQARYGVRGRLAQIGRQVIRRAMPLQHREFFAQLPFIALAGVDPQDQPQATLLAGPGSGFVSSPDETTLRVDALPLPDDPITPQLAIGAPIGVLGIDLATRRRNRANGVITGFDGRGFGVRVRQSFGNCPKYIQVRQLLTAAHPMSASRAMSALAASRRSDRLDATSRALVQQADTFFIATHAAGERASGGSDMSHRGGRPGFVRISDDGRTLTWPEFAGNLYFNTLGNLLVQPRAAIVVADFERADLLHINGRCAIEWNGPDVEGFSAARQMVHMNIDEVLWRPHAWPLRGRLAEPSPYLLDTGRWE
jgi:predicted pyridoxine 5'-phosphate oxidase superfamily flavin-nucleotide-binding protein